MLLSTCQIAALLEELSMDEALRDELGITAEPDAEDEGTDNSNSNDRTAAEALEEPEG